MTEHADQLDGPEVYMALVLIYRGPLPAVNDKDKRTKEKQAMRRLFHAQLTAVSKKAYRLHSNAGVFRPSRIGQFNICSLICKDPNYPRRGCELEIRILSNDPFGAICDKGDLDNRLKVVFDALSLPDKQQLSGDHPHDDENPFWVLLSNDRLITDLHIVQDTIHIPTNPKNYVELTITVKIKDGYET
jgi:hypothetical protein